MTPGAGVGVLGDGTGALRLLRELRRALPHREVLYLDCMEERGSAPSQLWERGVETLRQKGAAMIVFASPRASVVLDRRRMEALCGETAHTDLLMPGVRSACALSARGVIGALADAHCVGSGFFGRAVRSVLPGCRVVGGSCDSGRLAGMSEREARAQVSAWARPLLEERVDTLLLGDTQLGAFCDIINELFSQRVTLIDCVRETVQHVQATLVGSAAGPGETQGKRSALGAQVAV